MIFSSSLPFSHSIVLFVSFPYSIYSLLPIVPTCWLSRDSWTSLTNPSSEDILIQNSINHGCEVGGIWNRLEWDAMDQYSPSPRTVTCSFSEYKIYPGHGGMYIRKDGQVKVVRVSVITSLCVTWTRSAALWTSRRRDPLAFAGRLLGDVTTRSRR